MWELLFGTSASKRLDKMLEYNQRPLWSNIPQGWECPKCGAYHAPSVFKFLTCTNTKPLVSTSSTKDKPEQE